MKSSIGLSVAATALILSGCSGKGAENVTASNATGATASSSTAIKAPAGTTWSTTVSKTADGGFVIGNPAAPVKVVEYLSLTCPHCGEFAKVGFPALHDKYIEKGTVSLEIRNYVRDAIDVSASLVARCNGAAPFLPLTEQIFANQEAMFDKAQKISKADQNRVGALPALQQYGALASLVGLDEFARQHGIGDAKLKSCMADKAAVDELVAMQKFANEKLQIQGTPSFLINGKLLDNTATWETLEPQLIAAGA
jgi:protein-disulfide isomerase